MYIQRCSNSGTKDISSWCQLLSYTPTDDGIYEAVVCLALAPAGDVMTMDVCVAGVPLHLHEPTASFGAAEGQMHSEQFTVPSGTNVKVHLQSDNGADTAIGIISSLREIPAGNVCQWQGVDVMTPHTFGGDAMPMVNVCAWESNNLVTGFRPCVNVTCWCYSNLAANPNIPVNVECWNGRDVCSTCGTLGIGNGKSLPMIQVCKWKNCESMSQTSSGGTVDVNVREWLTQLVASDTNGIPNVNVCEWLGGDVCSSVGATGAAAGKTLPMMQVWKWKECDSMSQTSSGGTVDVNVKEWRTTQVCGTIDINGFPKVDVAEWKGTTAKGANGFPCTDVCLWNGQILHAVNTNGVPVVDVCYWDGVAVAGDPVSGLPNVNVEEWRGNTAEGDLGGFPCVVVNAVECAGYLVRASASDTPGCYLLQTDVCKWYAQTAQGVGGYPSVNVCCWDQGPVSGFGIPAVDVSLWNCTAACGIGMPCVNVNCWYGTTAALTCGLPRTWPCCCAHEHILTHGDANWASICFSGVGSISVDHDYGGTDNLAYIVDGGQAVDDATVQAYLKTDYDAGNRTRNYVRAETRTDANGRFENEFRLNADTYTFVYYKQGEYGPDTQDVVVSS